jgi:hypothetical protein
MLEAVVQIKSKSEFSTVFVLVGSCCGCVLLLAGTLLLLRKHMKALQGVVVTVFGEVGKFVLQICSEIGDLITECDLSHTRISLVLTTLNSWFCVCSIITSHKVIFVSGFVDNEPLRLAFIAVIALSIVFSLAAFGLRIALAKSMSKSIMDASASLPDDGSFRARAAAIRRRSIDMLVGPLTLVRLLQCAPFCNCESENAPSHSGAVVPQGPNPQASSVSALKPATVTFDDSLATMLRQLHWEKKKIARDLQACGITLLTMFFEVRLVALTDDFD